jgi:glycosyltransferase involved in cell wall biosynthesis
VPNHELPLWHAVADVVGAPSLLEAFGIPAIEAGASGLPVVATTTGGFLDTIDPSTGILVPPGDVAALADALTALVGDPTRARALGRAARARVLGYFTWDRVADTLAGYYDAILGRAAAAA